MDRFIRRLGGKVGIGVALLGFFVIFLGWNGAASFADLRQQFPYLLSGGLIGIGLVILGAALLVTESLREQRAELLAALHRLELATNQAGGGSTVDAVHALEGQVIAARLSFHRPDCRLVQGQTGLRALEVDAALAERLEACRICDPLALPTEAEAEAEVEPESVVPTAQPRRRRPARTAG